MADTENKHKHDKDVEAPEEAQPTAAAAATATNVAPGLGVSTILSRWKREDLMKRGSLALTGLTLIFSFLAFVITASNKYDDELDDHDDEEYHYLLAVAILATLYAGAQTVKQIYEISTGKYFIPRRIGSIIDFSGDQIAAYLLISAASAAIPQTDHIRDYIDNSFSDSSAAAISMAFLGFLTMALSAMISGQTLYSCLYLKSYEGKNNSDLCDCSIKKLSLDF